MPVRCSSRAIYFAAAFLVPLAADAANKTWTSAVNGNFGANSNWTGGVPGPTDQATFSASGAYAVTFDNTSGSLPSPVLNQDLFVSGGNVTFTGTVMKPYLYWLTGAGGDDANITGGTLNVGGGFPLNMTIDDDLVVRSGASMNINAGSTVNTVDLLVGQSGGGTLTVTNGSALVVTGNSTQSLGLNGGSGQLTLQNNATGSFTGLLDVGGGNTGGTIGTVTIQSGADLTTGNLAVGTATASATGTVNINGTGSTLVQSGAAALTVGTTASGTGAINIGTTASGGSLTTGTGLFTLNKKGTVSVGGASTTGSLLANGNVIIDGGHLHVLNAGSSFQLAAGKTLTLQNLGDVTGSTPHTMAANSTYNITSDSTWSAPLNVGSTAQVNINSGGWLDLFKGVVIDGGLVNNAGGAVEVHSFIPGVQDQLTVTNGGRLLQTPDPAQGYLLTYTTWTVSGANSTIETPNHLSICEGSRVNVTAGGTLNVRGNLALYFTQNSPTGPMPLGGVLTLDGGTLIAATLGEFQEDSPEHPPVKFDFISGTFRVTGPAGVTLGGTKWIAKNYALDSVHNLTVNNTLTIPVDSSFTLNGGILSIGDMVNQGRFNFNSGTLAITGPAGLTVGTGGLFGSSLGITSSQTINVTNTATVNSNAILAILGGHFSAGSTVNNGAIYAANATIGGAVLNNHEVIVSGVVDFAGLVSGAGGFYGPGTAHFNGGFAPGASPANVSVEGNVNFADSNTLFIEIGGKTAGSQYDRLTIDGSATLDGTLNLSLINGFTPTGGQQFTILTASSIVNNGFVLSGAAAGSFSLIVGATSVILQAVAVTGDYNHNGVVDAADYVVWRHSVGQTGPGLAADGNNNNQIDSGDLDIWRSHFGQAAGAGANSGSSAAVPEPNSLVAVFVAMMAFIGRRRVVAVSA